MASNPPDGPQTSDSAPTSGAWARFWGSVQEIGGIWTGIAAAGTFLLYLLGYLSLRFRLTALGVGTDLNFLDERYLFEGAHFLVYTVSILLNLVLLGLAVAGLSFLVWQAIPCRWRAAIKLDPDSQICWMGLVIIGVILSLLTSQVFMRKAFLFNDLLVSDGLPDDTAWPLNSVLIDDVKQKLYFHALVAAAVVVASCLLATLRAARRSRQRAWIALLAFLFAAQVLLLPINHGVLLRAAQNVPRVGTLDGASPLAEGSAAWLVWEGRDGLTFLVVGPSESGGLQRRRLVTLSKEKITRTEVLRYDNLIVRFFSNRQVTNSAKPAKEASDET